MVCLPHYLIACEHKKAKMYQPLPIFLAPTPKTSSFLLSPSIVSFFQGYTVDLTQRKSDFFLGGGGNKEWEFAREKRESKGKGADTTTTRASGGAFQRRRTGGITVIYFYGAARKIPLLPPPLQRETSSCHFRPCRQLNLELLHTGCLSPFPKKSVSQRQREKILFELLSPKRHSRDSFLLHAKHAKQPPLPPPSLSFPPYFP